MLFPGNKLDRLQAVLPAACLAGGVAAVWSLHGTLGLASGALLIAAALAILLLRQLEHRTQIRALLTQHSSFVPAPSRLFAYSGYLMLQLTHLGMACGYAWMPLGLWSIDQAVSTGKWRPLWKLALASSLCFLSGHPPSWFTFCACMLAYAAFCSMRWKALTWTAAALVYSCLLSMVQILPTWEASALKEIHENYGAGIKNPIFYISYLIPNYFDFDIRTPPFTNLAFEYLYLGAPAFFGLLWLLSHPTALRRGLPILGIGIASAILLTNPYDLVWNTIKYSSLLAQICRSWQFLAGISVAAAGLAAVGLDTFLNRERRPLPRWITPFTTALLAAWSARQVWMWRPGGPAECGVAVPLDDYVLLLTERLKPYGVAVTRVGQGVPIGGALDVLDDGTLAAALRARRPS